MKKPAIALLIFIALLAGAYQYHKYRMAPPINFESLELTDLNGSTVTLQQYKGKKIFINFFATWCGPCVAEFPALDNAANQLMPDNFVFISVSDEGLPVLNHFNNRINLQHVTILHSVKKLHALRVFTTPTSYLLNSKGAVVFKKVEPAVWDQPGIIKELKEKAD